jgi:signal transduction histidine kinase/sensor domain CHASE-containing protein/ActR/RegA family two-component response regulator
MSLKFKTALILLAAFLIFGTVGVGIQYFIIFPSFLALEKEAAITDSKRVTQAITREIHQLDVLCHDWSAWDDTCQFVEFQSRDYIASNLTAITFRNNDLHLLYFIDSNGHVVWGKIYDPETGGIVHLAGFPEDAFFEAHPVIACKDGNKPLAQVTISGIFMTSNGPMLVSSRPVLDSNDKGPVRGDVIMGRFLNRDFVKKIADQTNVDLAIFSLHGDDLPEAVKGVPSRLTEKNPYLIKISADDYLQIYTSISDVKGDAALLIRSKIPRKIVSKGALAMRYSLFYALSAGMIIILVMLLLLKQVLVNPIVKLTDHAILIGKTGDLSLRASFKKNDEIGMLAHEFDSMVEHLNKKSFDLNERIKELNCLHGISRLIEKPGILFEDLLQDIVDLIPAAWQYPKITCARITLRGRQYKTQYFQETDKKQTGNIVVNDKSIGMLEVFSLEENPERAEEIFIEQEKQLIHEICDRLGKIAEAKLIEENLRISEERNRAILGALPYLMFILDKDGTYLDYRAPNQSDLYMSPDSFLGKNVIEVLPGKIADLFLKNMKAALKTGKRQDAEYQLVIDGKQKEFELLIGPYGKDKILSIVRNITGQKQAERAKKSLEIRLRQSHKMESIGTLSGGIAHDFNNILSPIIGYTEMTMADLPEGSMGRENMQEVLKAADRAKTLVQQILAFSRQSKPELKPLIIQPIIKEALKLLRSSIPSTIQFIQKIDNDCGPVMADPTQVHQIIMNLCTNASHAMQENGGTLEVKLTEVDMSTDEMIEKMKLRPGRYVRLTVSDTGCGIKPDVLERVFDPYFTTKASGKGTGMGLSVVHGIVKTHGGDIRVYSEPGQGATFHVYLPLIDTPSAGKTEKMVCEPIPGGKEHILLVDDEAQVVHMLRQILENIGYRITIRTCSREALEAFRARSDDFDLVVTDMTMPNMNGDKLAQELIRIRPDIPIILCTGFSETLTEEKVKAMGIRAYLMKPVVTRQIATTIRKVLDPAKTV